MGIYYTNQKMEAFRTLETTHQLSGNPSFIYPDFYPAYQWMQTQMKQRLNCPSTFPIWLWTTPPNLQESGHFPSGTKAVCLTLSIPDDQILLSDFDAWHCVLNNDFCSFTAEEDNLFEKGLHPLKKEQSWNRIFSIEEIQTSEHWLSEDTILQGVTPFIKKDQILQATFFTAV